ncbi:MAG: glucose-6-phosphate isomerase [Proteobacteria bacterium]|nr:glucose-6-phosphate isomerase [Pseudomonadota bacterium]
MSHKQMQQQVLPQWKQLEILAEDKNIKDIKGLFAQDSNRAGALSFEVADIFVDFSKNWVNTEVFKQLLNLAKASALPVKITSLFAGDKVNVTEGKPATHTAQRQTNASKQMLSDRQTMFTIAENYVSGLWRTAFGEKVTTIVNIGIGGSYLGPKLAVQALSDLQTINTIKILFSPSVDDAALKLLLKTINIRTTLFCISSKSLATIETILNTQSIKVLLEDTKDYRPTSTHQSFVAATANFDQAAKLGIPTTHVMPFDNATGGRFSVWSSIGFSVLMAIGEDRFKEFLSGAEKVDNHFENTQLENNVPVLMALLSIWYRNFMGLSAYAVIPYDVRLRNLPAWLQQLMMESNGKMMDVNGNSIDYSTSPWVFGDHGLLSQHAFFQAFHQGSDILPIDFIGVIDDSSTAQEFLLINMLSQSSALMHGSNKHNNCYCPGNRPSTTFLLKELSASSLGQLLALYEHMIFVQSVMWDINCFDQPGVELGKQIATDMASKLQTKNITQMNLDQSTQQLLSKVLNND